MRIRVVELNQPLHQVEVTEDSEIIGLFVGRGQTALKTRLEVIHTTPNLTSRTHIKSVLFDDARFDMEALLKIAPGAHHSDGYLKLDALVVGAGAFARAVPSLEIQEDEVKGGHGATVGHVQPGQLHYLLSRGLSPVAAENLIVEAFIADISAKIAHAYKSV